MQAKLPDGYDPSHHKEVGKTVIVHTHISISSSSEESFFKRRSALKEFLQISFPLKWFVVCVRETGKSSQLSNPVPLSKFLLGPWLRAIVTHSPSRTPGLIPYPNPDRDSPSMRI